MLYLIHFDRPFGHAQHYLGWTTSLERRLEHHRNGNGARLMAHVTNAGIDWQCVRTWNFGDEITERRLERRIKASGKRKACCPVCNPETTWYEEENDSSQCETS